MVEPIRADENFPVLKEQMTKSMRQLCHTITQKDCKDLTETLYKAS